MGAKPILVFQYESIHDPDQPRHEDENETFAQYGQKCDTPVIDGPGWVFFLEEGNNYTILPGLGHMHACNCPFPYEDHEGDQPW